MFDETVIQKLKQNNISDDGEKTKERVKELWLNANNNDKRTVETLAGVSRATVYRVYNTGSISAKLAVPIAQTFNVNPYFLTGETDERGECNDILVRDFLNKCGYAELLADLDNEPKKTNRKPKKIDESISEPLSTSETQETPEIPEIHENVETQEDFVSLEAPETKEPPNYESYHVEEKPRIAIETVTEITTRRHDIADIEDMNEQEMSILLQAGMIRRKYGEHGASEHIKELKRLLLSFSI